MASLLLGGALGYFFGPLGFLAGSALGALLDPQKGPQISDLHLQGSTYGAVIPICYGTMRVAGQVIWTTELHPHQSKGKGGPEVTTYTASFDVLICEGPIAGVQRIWADGTLIFDTTGTVTGLPSLPMVFYDGGEAQLPDPTEEAALGVGFVPAYRGYARAVFTELDLTNYGNSLPRLTFQVFSAGGAIPWRVSTFDAWPGHGVGAANRAGATYTDGVITTTFFAGGDMVQWSQFTPQGTQIGSAVPSSTNGNIGPYNGSVSNLNALMTGDSFFWYWNVTDPITGISAAVANLGAIGPQNPPGQVQQPAIALGNYVYEIGNPGFTEIGAYNLSGLDPGQLAGLTYTFSSPEVIINLGGSDTNQLYCITSPGGAGGGPYMLYRFLPNSLTVDTTWSTSTVMATYLQYYTGGNFFVYQDQIAVQIKITPNTYITAVLISGSTLTNSGQLLAGTGASNHLIMLSDGLGLDPIGVFSLFPPAGPVALSAIVADISNRCGLAASQYNVIPLIDEVPGYMISNQSTGRDNIMELRTAYFFDGVESSGVLKFIKRGGPSEISIPDNDLAAQVGHTGTPPPLAMVERTQEVDLPATMYVVFIDPNDQYLNGTQYARRLVTNSETVSTVQLAVALNVNTARAVAQLLLFTAWLERNTITFLVSRQYAVYEPTDVITAHGYTIRITDKTYVATNLIELKGVVTNTGAFIAGPGGAVSGGSPNLPPSSQSQSPTNLLMLNLPLIVDTDYQYGPYAAMAGTSAVLPWGGGLLYESTDGGTTYNQVATSDGVNVIGVVTVPPGNFTSGNMFDKINSVTVVVGNGGGTLSSATESAVLNGANVAYIGSGSGSGGEIIQFANATLMANNTYVLTDLLRGRRGTEWQIGKHAVGEIFVLLPCIDINGPFSDLGQPRLFKGLSGGQALSAVVPQSFLNSGETLRCYSPTNIYSAVDGSGNVTVNWTRRTRIGGSWADYTDVPLSEASESYVVQIWNSSFTICARVVGGNQSNPASGPALISSPTFTYTATMQTADFGQLEQHIYFSVGQVGTFGLGIQSFATLPGGGSSDTAPSHPVAPYNSGAPPTSPPAGCVGSPVTATPSNTFNWAANPDYISVAGVTASNYWPIVIAVSASPGNGLCKVSILSLTNGPLAAGSISATLSTVPCGPPMIPAMNWSGVNQIVFNFSIGPSPNPTTTPQLLASTSYYLTVYTTVPQAMQGTLNTQG